MPASLAMPHEYKALSPDGERDVPLLPDHNASAETADTEDVSLPEKPFSLKDHINQLERFETEITTTVLSAAGNKKILRYDMKALVRHSALRTIFSEGTVFTMDQTCLHNVLLMVVICAGSCLLMVIVFIFQFDKLQHVSVLPLEHMAAHISAFVPFVLGLYVSLTLTRWWQLRVTALGKVMDAFASISMLLNSELREKKWTQVRTQVAKYGFASVELLVQAARNKPDMKRLVQSDMLTPVEANVMKKYDELWQRPVVIWAWIMRIGTAAMDHNLSPPPRTMAVMNQCLAARQGIANINTLLDTQLPFAYVHLITLLVNVQNVTLSVKAGVIIATAIPQGNVFVMLQQVATCCIVGFIYQALLQISYVLLDPFGDDVLDFPCTAYMEYLAAQVDAMAEAQLDCPVVAMDGSVHRPRERKVVEPGADSFDSEE